MGSLLFNAALLGGGFVLGRVPLLPLAAQALDELTHICIQVVMVTLMALLLALYVLGVLLPLRWVASQEEQKTERLEQPEPTSFRRELRRRGSYSMSYVTDVKAHVFARC
ncbi:hypothetical protein JG688_00001863 [Phytophthora aleatoria]|uniref:Uncharacterized protein n=1 Tax=Phytophthora aleatoria TaxID=2496075 RepID=A0A8J5M968_9STRA|nr:hypothetical protein JG688_00001863 [Phytophthora aleatoria]